MIFYFTGTGNSMWIAERLGNLLNQPAKNIAAFREAPEVTPNDDIIGFVFPTYMNDLPWIAKEFLLKLKIPQDAYCFGIMTSNHGKSGRAFKSMNQGLAASGAALSAAFDIKMPGNCIPSTEEENRQRLMMAPALIEEICRAVQERTVNFRMDSKKPSADFVKKSYLYGDHSLKRFTLLKKFSCTENCNGCGICAEVCPMDNIKIAGKEAIHGKDCAACYACLHWCPEHAVLPVLPTLKKRKQYTHPEVSLEELIKSKTGR